MTETLFGDVAPAHRFDEAALAAYLNRHIDDFGADMKVLADSRWRFQPDLPARDFRQRRREALRPAQEATGTIAGECAPGGPRISRHEGAGRHRRAGAAHAPSLQRERAHRHAFLRHGLSRGPHFPRCDAAGPRAGQRAAVYDALNATLARLHQVITRCADCPISAARAVISSVRLRAGPSNIAAPKAIPFPRWKS